MWVTWVTVGQCRSVVALCDPCTRELIDELQNYTIVQVAAGDQHSLALTSWGLIYARGDNGYGQLGVNSCDSHTATRKLVKSLARKVTVQLACGANHTLALTAGGCLYLALRHRQGPQKDPALVTSLAGTLLVLLAAAGHHSAAVTQAGYLLLWGSNKQGQLGYTPKGDPLVRYTETVFASVCAWNSSLTLAGLHKHTHGLDYRLAEDCVAQIGRIARETIQEVASQDALRCYVLPLYKDFTDPKQTAKLQTPYAEGVLKLDKEMAEVFTGCRVGRLNYDDFYIPEIAREN
ncbi:probable E3 ubiquitin-protein ligase HERC4 [Scylla paramamosain]|uniref:probable E3 ubiquitin-protein ligase HERC4 n=1 Tax=Scylla paramamosain TaxID=85552 RepID=UPI0030837E4E